ncbi:MAG TPA: M48 family metallopeptidase [Ramlibacter sp.]|jgi:Zn-dependent protease with chaperone function|uniref:M48 family metallopeptidase n=1 Tax=Ramlibacter sp. TaxID=1917967 RepID=UPI002D58FE6F|nr:M48 family metallopeptidase [Ramlibacter sp.]HZY18254.1 M48 family metallopeptidase [Ramlibacter sp.]
MRGSSIGSDLAKVLLYAVLALFTIPALTYGFVRHVQSVQDRDYLRTVEDRLLAGKLSSDEPQQVLEGFRRHPLSSICDDGHPEARTLRQAACATWAPVWQFDLARKASLWTLVLGAAILAGVGALGALAFLSRSAQLWSLVAGWRLLMLGSAAEVALQGAMCLWLSYWVTAFFFHKYFVKLVLLAAVFVLLGIGMVVMGIFRRPRLDNEVVGEPVGQADAPRLWRRVQEIARRMKTAPPDHIVAGIDANFFVTEAGLRVGGKELKGRCLYVSIPLLKVLDRSQADAVLGHELAHFRGGDTRASAQLGPRLVQFDHYVDAMAGGGLTRLVWPFMQLYRLILQVALSRDSREREFKADRTAARLVSPQAVVEALVKVMAYSHYRGVIESSLFDSRKKLQGRLGLAESVAGGLHRYASSDDFVDDMHAAHVPHPFDSHPPLVQRMQNVGFHLDPDAYGKTVSAPPHGSWADDIASGDAIEQRLWSAYEAAFAQQHELSLAYRYWPRNEDELAVVLKYFPPVTFALKKGGIEVNHRGIAPDGEPELPWDDVKDLQYQESSFGDSLTVTLNDKGMVGHKTRKLGLSGLGKQKDAFNAAVAQYWHRHQVSRGRD